MVSLSSYLGLLEWLSINFCNFFSITDLVHFLRYVKNYIGWLCILLFLFITSRLLIVLVSFISSLILSSLSVNCRGRHSQTSHYDGGFVYYSLKFSWFLLYIFWDCGIRKCKLRITYLAGELKFLKNNYVRTLLICNNVLIFKFFSRLLHQLSFGFCLINLLAFNLSTS